MDSNSLSHTKWNCKYHIVFAPKYRRKVAYGKIKQDIATPALFGDVLEYEGKKSLKQQPMRLEKR